MYDSSVKAFTLVLCLLCATAAVAGEPALHAVAQRKTLRVGMLAGVAPFVATGADADSMRAVLGKNAPPLVRAVDGRTVCGFDVELASAAAQALSATLEITLVDRYEELLSGLRDGRYELVASALTRTLERATTIAFSDPYFASGLQVLVRDPARFPLLDALRKPGVKVAFLAGTTAASFAERELAAATRVPLASETALLSAIDDAAVADALVIDYVTARDAQVRGRVKSALVPLEERRFTTEQFAFAVRQGDPDWVAWLNLFLKHEKVSGGFHRLAARYNAWFRSER